VHKRILIVEDEASIRDMVAFALRKAGMDAAHAADARAAQMAISERVPDLILLDWMLPGTSGLELARRLRREELSREIPIIMLTARGEEMDRVNGLEAGVDDYVIKPFSTRELIARIKAVLRRSQGDDGSGVVELGGLRIDGPAHRVFAGEEAVPIGPTEYRLLYHLVQNAGYVMNHEQLLTKVWGPEYREETHYLRLYITYLRQKIEEDPANPKYIMTERGIGYWFVDFRKEAGGAGQASGGRSQAAE
jgi:two-component system phosphate regulon response regulator PhoB